MPPVYYGGIERVVDLLAKELSARGHSISLFAHSDSQTAGTLFPWPGRTSNRRADLVRNMSFLARHVSTGRFDLVHSFSRIAYLLPLLPSRLPKLMTYQRAVSPRSVSLGTKLSSGSLWFTAVSTSMMNGLGDLGTWRMIPNGVPLETFPFVSEVPVDAPLVFLGRIEEIKGPHLAIDIARRSGKRLVIAGNIPEEYKDWARKYVLQHVDGDQVQYVGPVNDESKSELLGQASAFLMPILWEEPFGIVMAEAMACGTPVLALARGAAPEVVQHGVTGFVQATVDALVEDVARIDSLHRRDCRHRVEQAYSQAAITDGYLDVYEEMVRSVRRRMQKQSVSR